MMHPVLLHAIFGITLPLNTILGITFMDCVTKAFEFNHRVIKGNNFTHTNVFKLPYYIGAIVSGAQLVFGISILTGLYHEHIFNNTDKIYSVNSYKLAMITSIIYIIPIFPLGNY